MSDGEVPEEGGREQAPRALRGPVVLMNSATPPPSRCRDWDLGIATASPQEVMRQGASPCLCGGHASRKTAQLGQGCRPAPDADIVLEIQPDRGRTDVRIVRAKKPVFVLECSNPHCRHQIAPIRASRCRRCGSDLVCAIVGDIDFPSSIDDGYESLWRYRSLMPLDDEFVIDARVGTTPVVYLTGLSERLGVHVWAKLETANPTGTFKDREAIYVVALSRQFGQDNLVMQSTGNTAIAMSHAAGLAGLASWAFIPERCAYKLLMPPRRRENRIVAVRGHPIDVKHCAEDFALRHDFPRVSPFHERCEANATQGYEIAEGLLRGTLPQHELLDGGFDFYVQTIAAGMGPIGYYLAMDRLQRWCQGGVRMPRIVAVEIDQFCPILDAWENGREAVGAEVATPRFPSGEVYEPTLWTTNIASYYPHLARMLRETNGMLVAVSPEQVTRCLEEYDLQNELAGIGCHLVATENSPWVGFAGMVQRVLSGEIPRGSRVLFMLTGKGQHGSYTLQEPDFVADPHEHGPEDIMAALGQ